MWLSYFQTEHEVLWLFDIQCAICLTIASQILSLLHLGLANLFLLNPRDVVEFWGILRNQEKTLIVVWRFCPLLCLAEVANFRITFKLYEAPPIRCNTSIGPRHCVQDLLRRTRTIIEPKTAVQQLLWQCCDWFSACNLKNRPDIDRCLNAACFLTPQLRLDRALMENDSEAVSVITA